MPKKGVAHKKWNPENMKNAIEAIKSKQMGYLKASKTFNIPKATLELYVKRGRPLEEQCKLQIGRKPVLTAEMEEDLVQHCLDMDKRYYGLGIADIRRLAYQLAIRNNLPHPFSKKDANAGKKWLRNFFKRHPNISLRKPQGISKNRIKGFTPENINLFFDLLEPVMEKVNFNPFRVYNVDETGITTVQSKVARVITLKGKKQVGAVTAAERGALVTVVTCMNAAGGFVPPLFVFPRKNMKAELLDGAPAGSIAECHPSGWIQSHIFTRWMQHFINHVKPSKEDPVLLILDGHYSHTRNLDVIDLAKRNFVSIVCIPPHTSHKIQPLDLAFMSPLKTYYSREIQNWLKNNPTRNISPFQICKLFCPAYQKCATAEISANGFRKAGIIPFNRNIFSESDFLIERQRERTPPRQLTPDNTSSSAINISNSSIQGSIESTPPKQQTDDSVETKRLPSVVKIQDFSPLPSCSSVPTTNRGRKAGSAAVITSTPYKSELEASVKERERKESLKKKGKGMLPKPKALGKTKKKTINKTKKVKKNQKFEEDSDSSDSSQDLPHDDDSDMDADENGDATCIFCTENFSDNQQGEVWVQCSICFRWAHEDCAGSEKTKAYVCDFCFEK